MAQHFLLSTAARTLSLAKVMRMTEDQAFDAFRAIRWAETDGDAVCGKCGGCECYTFKARRIFKCKACGAQFSVTSGTIFASRKMPLRDILAAIAIFVNGAKGHSALQLSRDLDVQYKTAFVLTHKLREALNKGPLNRLPTLGDYLALPACGAPQGGGRRKRGAYLGRRPDFRGQAVDPDFIDETGPTPATNTLTHCEVGSPGTELEFAL